LTGGNADGATAYNYLYGGTGDDTLTGGNSSNGGSVENYLRGDDGTDTFVFNSSSGQSTIYDFTAGSGTDHDIIDASAYGFQSLDEVVANTTDYSGYCVIQLDQGNSVTLVGVAKDAFTSDDFIL
jgi:hypothetical protein